MNGKKAWRLIAIITAVIALTAISAVKDSEQPIQPPQGNWVMNFGNHDAGLYFLTVWNDLEEGQVSGDNPEYKGLWPSSEGASFHYNSCLWCGYRDDEENKIVAQSQYYTTNVDWIPEETIEGISNPSNDRVPMSNSGSWPSSGPDTEIKSDLDSWVWCQDTGNEIEIGVWVCRHGYQWGVPDHDDWIVYHYTMKNISGHTLKDLFFAARYDIDMGDGDHMDDLVGYEGNDSTDEYTNPTQPGQTWSDDTPDGIPDEYDFVNFNEDNGFPEGKSRDTSYMYDQDNVPQGWHGVRIFGYFRTFDPDWDYDTPENNVPNPDYWVEVSSQHSWDINNDPQGDGAKYTYMSDVGTFTEIPDTPFDWRINPAIGPLEAVEDGEEIDFYFVDCLGEDLLEMRRNLDNCVNDWLGADNIPYTSDDWIVAAAPPSPLLAAIPGDLSVTLHFNPNYAPGKNTETEPDTQNLDPDTGENVIDFDGYVIWRSEAGFDQGWVPIYWIDKFTDGDYDERNCYRPWGWRDNGNPDPDKQERVPDGEGGPTEPDLKQLYDTNNYISYDDFKNLQDPDTAYYVFEDNGEYPDTVRIKNGFRFFYAVTPYDFGAILNDEDAEPENDIYILPVIGGRTANQTYCIPLPPAKGNLDDVVVVPNPYIGSADWEGWAPSLVRELRIAFMNLPNKCTIDIYTISGNWVDRIEHNDANYGTAYWDLANFATEVGIQIASGVYIYHIDAPGIGEKIGKFAVIMGEQ